jgi:hypothetical protein
MPCNTIICDWNGTLIAYRDERPVLETMTVDLFKASFPFHPLRRLRIYRTPWLLEELPEPCSGALGALNRLRFARTAGTRV